MGTPAGVSRDRLFLLRNTGRSREEGADQDPQLLEVFAQVAINNGLECKVACSNSKVGACLCVFGCFWVCFCCLGGLVGGDWGRLLV
jgi:hypothetical protein